MTSEKPIQATCRTLTFSAEDFPASLFRLLETVEDSTIPRGTLFFEIARLTAAKRPAYLLLENVPGLLNHDGGRTFAAILHTLDGLGYGVEWHAALDCPQSEKGCTLSDILISDAEEKYFLSPKQQEHLLCKSFPERRENECTPRKG